MAGSDDEVYRQAVDLRMLYQLADLMVDYFHLRAMGWRGEEEAIRFWRDNDPDYLALFTRCQWAPDRAERISLYRDLVEATVEPAGYEWDLYGPNLKLSPAAEMTPENLAVVKEFWRSLILN